MQRANSLENIRMMGRLKAKGEEGDRGWLDSITDSIHVDVNLSKLQEIVKDRGAWRAGGQVQAQAQQPRTTNRLQGNANRSMAKKAEMWRPSRHSPSRVSNSGSGQERGC